MGDAQILLLLHQIEGFGWATIAKLVGYVERVSVLCSMNRKVWAACGISAKLADRALEQLAHADERVMQLERNLQRLNIRYVTIYDDDYPYLLRKSADPPWVLYYQGNLALTEQLCIAMVGTRRASTYGRRTALRFAEQLSEHGVCVVSGLAQGIDGYAHEGALRHSGGTIAVMGTAIDRIYPAHHRALHDRIMREGLVLSEYPPGYPGHAGLFPRRNRIIAGLSRGVLVIEAAARSGSLITADCALDESRDVFAVPGQIDAPNSAGTLNLLKMGAKLTLDVADILEEYLTPEQMQPPTAATADIPLSQDEQYIMKLLMQKSCSTDELLAATKFSFGHLQTTLLSLQLKKKVEPLPGSMYITK